MTFFVNSVSDLLAGNMQQVLAVLQAGLIQNPVLIALDDQLLGRSSQPDLR